jgi:anti-anti-sigma factor
MTINITINKDHCLIKIDGDLTIFQISEYHQQLADKCQSVTLATVELSDNTELDTAGIQLLISLQQQFQSTGGDLTVRTTGEPATKVIDLFNLSSQFNSAEKAELI